MQLSASAMHDRHSEGTLVRLGDKPTAKKCRLLHQSPRFARARFPSNEKWLDHNYSLRM
jgi:hypothetical protein